MLLNSYPGLVDHVLVVTRKKLVAKHWCQRCRSFCQSDCRRESSFSSQIFTPGGSSSTMG